MLFCVFTGSLLLGGSSNSLCDGGHGGTYCQGSRGGTHFCDKILFLEVFGIVVKRYYGRGGDLVVGWGKMRRVYCRCVGKRQGGRDFACILPIREGKLVPNTRRGILRGEKGFGSGKCYIIPLFCPIVVAESRCDGPCEAPQNNRMVIVIST